MNNACRGNSRAEYLKLAAERLALQVKKNPCNKYDATVDGRFQALLLDWADAVPPERVTRVQEYLRIYTGGTPFTDEMIARKSVATRGYIPLQA